MRQLLLAALLALASCAPSHTGSGSSVPTTPTGPKAAKLEPALGDGSHAPVGQPITLVVLATTSDGRPAWGTYVTFDGPPDGLGSATTGGTGSCSVVAIPAKQGPALVTATSGALSCTFTVYGD